MKPVQTKNKSYGNVQNLGLPNAAVFTENLPKPQTVSQGSRQNEFQLWRNTLFFAPGLNP
jgi:hypothetical protein